MHWQPVRAFAGSRGAARPHRLRQMPPPSAQPGWGFYMRQRLRDDESAPLAIYDELGGVTLYRDRR